MDERKNPRKELSSTSLGPRVPTGIERVEIPTGGLFILCRDVFLVLLIRQLVPHHHGLRSDVIILELH